MLGVRFMLAIVLGWGFMALAQYCDLAVRVYDGRARNMSEAFAMADYPFGMEFWLIPATVYATLLLVIRLAWRLYVYGRS